MLENHNSSAIVSLFKDSRKTELSPIWPLCLQQ